MEVAIIGVIGTLLGTVLGWCLNYFSQKGRIKIYPSSWTEKLMFQGPYGMTDGASSQDETDYYEYTCSIDFYNSSMETRIIREIRIVFYTGKTVILESIPNDEKTKRSAGGRTLYDTIVSQNIPSHSVINLKLSSGLWIKESNLQALFDADSVYFEYIAENNKKKKSISK